MSSSESRRQTCGRRTTPTTKPLVALSVELYSACDVSSETATLFASSLVDMWTSSQVRAFDPWSRSRLVDIDGHI